MVGPSSPDDGTPPAASHTDLGRRGTIWAVIGALSVVGALLVYSDAVEGRGASPGAPVSGKTLGRHIAPGAPMTAVWPRAQARPTRLVIPRLRLSAVVAAVTVAADGTLEAPPAGARDTVGWFGCGPAPGQRGTAVIDGRAGAPAEVFFGLTSLRPGDRITVERTSGTSATFTVYAVRTYDGRSQPTGADFATRPHPELRLVTSGAPRPDARGARDVIVFARLTAAERP